MQLSSCLSIAAFLVAASGMVSGQRQPVFGPPQPNFGFPYYGNPIYNPGRPGLGGPIYGGRPGFGIGRPGFGGGVPGAPGGGGGSGGGANCPTFCTQQYSPVCGFNGRCYRTFGNGCELSAAACSGQGVFRQVSNGECPRRQTC